MRIAELWNERPAILFEEERKKEDIRAKGGRARKWNTGLQLVIDQLYDEAIRNGHPFTLSTVCRWFADNAPPDRDSLLETGIDDCDELYFEADTLSWVDSRGKRHERKKRSLERYIRCAKEPLAARSSRTN